MLNFGFLLEGQASGTDWIGTILMIVAFVAILYFFMIRPQKKQEKRDAEMRDALAVGDEVTTIGGIIGKIVSIKGETFVLESTKDKTKIRFLKGAIRSVDVKAADIAAAVIEGQSTEAAATEETVATEETEEAK
jgi:preprotein translocase subunit YajC